MRCHTNCGVLNLTTCTYLQDWAGGGRQVQFDQDGCFAEGDYLSQGDKYSVFIQVHMVLRNEYKINYLTY